METHISQIILQSEYAETQRQKNRLTKWSALQIHSEIWLFECIHSVIWFSCLYVSVYPFCEMVSQMTLKSWQNKSQIAVILRCRWCGVVWCVAWCVVCCVLCCFVLCCVVYCVCSCVVCVLHVCVGLCMCLCLCYGVATIRRLLKIISLFGRISSLL